MSFGEILDSWEKQRRAKESDAKKKRDAMERLLSQYPPEEAPAEEEEPRAGEAAARRRRRLRAMAPQRVLDLHGARARDVEQMVESFLREGRRCGLEKLLIIHGKGKHSEGEPVLRKAVIRVLEKSAVAGEYGEAARKLGGSGALWVVLRQRSR